MLRPVSIACTSRLQPAHHRHVDVGDLLSPQPVHQAKVDRPPVLGLEAPALGGELAVAVK
jgi:hypothetical protein